MSVLDRSRLVLPLVVMLAISAAAAPSVHAQAGAAEDTSTQQAAAPEWTARQIRRIRRLSPMPPLPADPTNRFADHPGAVALGQALFFDRRLAGPGAGERDLSCAGCHDPRSDFDDGKPIAEAVGTMTRHTPSLWNVGHQRWFFWDGRTDTLWSQPLDPIEAANEMASSRGRVIRLLRDDARLRTQYENIFGGLPPSLLGDDLPADARPVPGDATHAHARAWQALTKQQQGDMNRCFANVGKALAAYMRRLDRGNSPFDRFVATLEQPDAPTPHLSLGAQRGLALFVGRGNCLSCHGGTRLTDDEFHDTGVAPLHETLPADAGRYAGIAALQKNPFRAAGEFSDDRTGAIAKRAQHIKQTPQNYGRFKTPSLRNVALTAPYMHQGQLPTLEAVVRFYSTREGARPPGHHEEQILQPLHLTDREIADLVAFLHSLTGTAPAAALLTPPTASTSSTAPTAPTPPAPATRPR